MSLLTVQKQTPCAPTMTGRSLLLVTPTDPAPHPAEAAEATVTELRFQLFNQADRIRVHAPWRDLMADPEFAYRPGLTPAEQIARSYQRLHLVNEASTDPSTLALDPYRLSAMHEWIGAVDGGLCALASIHYNLFLGALLDHDDRGRDLSPFLSLEHTGTFLCTELEHGNDAAALQTTAVYDRASGGFTLHTPTVGAQKFMPNTSPVGGPKSGVVAARLLVDEQDQGVFLFLVPLSDASGPLPGIEVRRLPSRVGPTVDHCLTSFEGVRLPREALLEAEHGRLDDQGVLSSSLGNRRKRFLRSVGRVTMGKLCVSAGALGMARTALTIAVRYAHVRHISGPRAGERVPLAAHRSHHGRLLTALAKCYAMTLLHRTAVSRWVEHAPEEQADVERLVAVTKSWVTWQAREIAIECRERCGAQGLFPFNNVAEQQLNIEGSITAEGDNLVIAVKAASEMIFGHETPQPRLREHPTDRTPLTDPLFLRDLLAGVEDIWQQRSRQAMRSGPKGNPLGRWNAACSPALEIVSAYTRRLAADAFLETIEQTIEPGARTMLENLYRLFVLTELGEHTGTLVAENRLHVDHVRALPAAIEEVIAELAPSMLSLVDAFDLPEEYLATVPIANDGHCLRVNDLAEEAWQS